MPDFVLMVKAMVLSGIVAGSMLLLVARRKLSLQSWQVSVAWALALAAGFYAGCGVLGQWPRWPVREDRDRLLAILLPLALATELAAPFLKTWGACLLRGSIAFATTPVLLYHTVYLADLSGPGSARWSRGGALLILLLLGGTVAGVWGLVAFLQSRTSERTVAPVLVMVSLAAGMTVMLSGYYQGGLLAFPLAGTIAGAALVTFAIPRQPRAAVLSGFGILGLFSILLIGHYFGSLPTSWALCLLTSPLLAWVAEVPQLRKLSPRVRASIGWIMVALPLLFVLILARSAFLKAFGATSSMQVPLLP